MRRRRWHPTPVLLSGKSHGWRGLVGCSPWGRKESDTTERLHFHFSLSCIGEEMATHSSVLAWRIPGTEEPGVLQSMGSQRVRHDLQLNNSNWYYQGLRTNSEKAMAPHSSTLVWKISWAEEPGRLQSMGLLRVRHD